MDASIGLLLQYLKELVLYQVNLIKGAERELRELTEDLSRFRAILEDASSKYNKDSLFERWERQIREAVYDIEDVIDTCVTEAKSAIAGRRNWLRKTFSTTSPKGTLALAQEVKNIRQKVNDLMKEFEAAKFTIADETDPSVADGRLELKKSRHIVGREDEARVFIDLLIRSSDKLEICSIIGMSGLGKTTLAWKIFEDPTIKFEFPVRIWVNVSDNLNMRKVLLNILSNLTSTKPDASVTNDELIMKVKCHLADEKFFIVMDDIWTIDAWKMVKVLLPMENACGRVLVTTRNKDVGIHSSASSEQAHYLRFLTRGESWELLQYEVYGKLGVVPEELEHVGLVISNDCNGLPLSIIAIGGILEKKTLRSSHYATLKEWEEVSASLKYYLVEEGTMGLLGSVLSLQYSKLPYKLRHCFLYLGVFPEDADIPVKKLIWLWIAEGLVQKSDLKTLEEVALDNLKELINWNLVMVRVSKLNGEPKICQIHDSIREICKTESRKLDLFTEICKPEAHPGTEKIRRLCIHSNTLDFFSRKPKLPKARSFICFSESPMVLEGTDATCITDSFGLLRVYEANHMKFKIYPAKFVQQLHHLRYLTLVVASELSVLPESLTNLWNLQTLIVGTPSSRLEVKGDIWKMWCLRHIKTNASIVLSKEGGENHGGKELQTLARLSPESCTYEVCRKAKSLVTLGIQGDLRNLSNLKCLTQLDSLHKLKLVHEVSRGGTADYPLRFLPDFPPQLKILVLSSTRLGWEQMSILSGIDTLEVLKLKEQAFQGKSWEALGRGFIHLKGLHIERTDLELWKSSSDHFPELRSLHIQNCENLREIPSPVGKKLEVLSLEHVSRDAVANAAKIVEEQKLVGRVVRLDII